MFGKVLNTPVIFNLTSLQDFTSISRKKRGKHISSWYTTLHRPPCTIVTKEILKLEMIWYNKLLLQQSCICSLHCLHIVFRNILTKSSRILNYFKNISWGRIRNILPLWCNMYKWNKAFKIGKRNFFWRLYSISFTWTILKGTLLQI